MLGVVRRNLRFIADVGWMMSGRTLAAAIALFTMPIVARLFDPADFGVAASFMALVAIIAHIASLRYERAIVLPDRDDEAKVIMALTYRILLLTCVVVLCVLLLLDLLSIQVGVLQVLGSWKWLVPLTVLLTAGLQIQEAWIARKQGFRLLAASTTLGSVVNSSMRIGAGIVWGSSIAGLVTSNIVSVSSRIAFQRAASVEGLKSIFHRYGLTALRKKAVNYSDFPRFDAPAGLVFSLGNQLPVVLFGTMFSPTAAGLYAMANRLSQAPITVVAGSTRRVFLQKAAKIRNQGKSLLRAYLLTTGGLVAVGILPFSVIWLYGQTLLVTLLGEKWLEAGSYLEIMAPWLFMLWIMAPTNPIFVVLRKQKAWLLLQTTLTIFRLGAFGLATLVSAGPAWTLQAFVTATVAGNLISIAFAGAIIVNADTPDVGDVSTGPEA